VSLSIGEDGKTHSSLRSRFSDPGVYVGTWRNKGSARALHHDGAQHTLGFAPARSGKDVGRVVPMLFSWPHSVVVNGIKAFLIVQDLSQLYAAYGHDESIISNCHVRVAYAPNKVETGSAPPPEQPSPCGSPDTSAEQGTGPKVPPEETELRRMEELRSTTAGETGESTGGESNDGQG
jgi:hypothetical protein